MAYTRFGSLNHVLNRKRTKGSTTQDQISSYYGSNVFSLNTMEKFLAPEAYNAVLQAINHGKKISELVADQIATAMKIWAMSKNATHYTHWFQPLTGGTAEKHDSFFEPNHRGGIIEKFKGNLLIQQESDASSFPHGGIRNTFEARGYTAWDPTSPAFIIGKTLCIPTIFVSYTGEALDYKTPLLKALHAVDKAAVEVCRYFGTDINKVNATLGWEQEYFLVDNAFFSIRLDLVLTGRTLIGQPPAKGQQLDDHYFGSIPERVLDFMHELENECYLLGIPVKSRHNEVAPGQYEVAPVFEECNISVDHNSLMMDLMEKIARRHHFKLLLHEKPFDKVNGSGKHNNWSLVTDRGKNLLSPGKTPEDNLEFLTFFVNIIKAIDTYDDLIRASITSAGNDHRLGANEAPPAIISVFIGSLLTQLLDDIEEMKFLTSKMSKGKKSDQRLNVMGKIPEIRLDNTDRNRTSPFAFTGNKFELRAVGSSANCADPMIILNTIVAQQLKDFKNAVDVLIEYGKIDKEEAIFSILKEYIKSSKNIRFEGDGYSKDWVKTADSRNLKNVKTTPYALDFYLTDLAMELFESNDIMSKEELKARHHIQLEKYQMRIQIESRVLGDLVSNYIVPSAVKYQNMLTENVKALKNVLDEDNYKKSVKEQLNVIKEISERISSIISGKNAMIEARKKANVIEDIRPKAMAYCNEVKPYLNSIRYHIDKLEILVDDDLWPLPKYWELLYSK